MKTTIALILTLLASTAVADTETVFNGSVYFDTGKASLSPEAAAVLDQAASVTQADDAVVAVGMADVRPFKQSSNSKLSQARADAVKSYLVLKGVPVASITASSVGDTKAKASKKASAADLAKDRRVDVTVTRTAPVVVPPPDCPPAEVVIISPPPAYAQVEGAANVYWFPLPQTEPEPTVRLLGHAALGVGARVPHWSGLLGARVHLPKVRLGAELSTTFAYGLAFQAMGYPVQSERLNWHAGLGVMGFGSRLVSTQDVPRKWDLLVGTGLEYKLNKRLSLTLDWRWAIPSPVFITENDQPFFDGNRQILGVDGKYLDVKHVLKNSLAESHFLLGVMFH